MELLKKNVQKTEVQSEDIRKIREAENGWMSEKRAIEDAVFELGKAYYEANKDNKESEFGTQIETINEKMNREYLWHQYRLSLEGQRMCDSCKSFITSDSAFCNRCGAPVKPIDFSVILGTSQGDNAQADVSVQTGVCPKCGRKLVEDAVFCEGCGTKVR